MKISGAVKEKLKSEITESILDRFQEIRIDEEKSLSRRLENDKRKATEELMLRFVQTEKNIIPEIVKLVFDLIPTPKDGKQGKNGIPGKDTPPLTKEEKKQIAGSVDITDLIKDRKNDLKKLITIVIS